MQPDQIQLAGPQMDDAARRRARRRSLLTTAGCLVLGYLAVRYLWSALVPIIGAGALYYLFAPVVRRLARYRVPRALTAIAVVLALLGALSFAVARVAPRAYEELSTLLADLPRRSAVAQSWLDERGLGGVASGAFERLRDWTQEGAPAGLLTWTLTAFGSLTTLAFTAVLAVYLLASGEDLARSAASWIPPQQRDRWLEFGHAASRLIAGYVRARVLASLFIGASYWLAFALLQVPQALLLGVVGGLLNFIPVVGPLIAAVPAIVITAFQGVSTVVGVTVVMILAQQIESSVIGPLVEGRFVRLPPAVIVVAIALGAALQGIPGMLVAVPVAAVTRQALLIFYRSTWTDEDSAAPLVVRP